MKRHSIAYLLANRSTIPLSLYTTINKNSCRYCANSSSLKSTSEEAISDSDKGAKSSDEKLKGILANIKLKRVPLDQVIQDPNAQKRDQKVTGNEQFVNHARTQARKEAVIASKAFKEKVKGTKMKQIQNELAELCEIALGAKDESGEHYGRGMRANAMSNELNKLQQQEEDTVYEGLEEAESPYEEETYSNMESSAKHSPKWESFEESKKLSNMLNRSLLQSFKESSKTDDSMVDYLNPIRKESKSKTEKKPLKTSEKEQDVNEVQNQLAKVLETDEGYKSPLMRAIIEHHERMGNKNKEVNFEKVTKVSKSTMNKSRKRAINWLEEQKGTREKKQHERSDELEQFDDKKATRYGSKFQQSVDLEGGETGLRALMQQFPRPSAETREKVDDLTPKEFKVQRQTGQNRELDEYFADISQYAQNELQETEDDSQEWFQERSNLRGEGQQRRDRRGEFSNKSYPLYGMERLNIFDPKFCKRVEVESSSEKAIQNQLDSTWNVLLHKDTAALFETPTQNGFEEMIKLTNQGKLWKFPISNEQGFEEEENVPFQDHVFLLKFVEDFPKHPRIQTFMEVVCVGLSKNHKLTFAKKLSHLHTLKQYFEERFELLKSSADFEDDQEID